MSKKSFAAEKFIEAAGDAIVAAGADGSILVWNAAAERLFGYAASEAIGQSLDLIIPERFRLRHWQGYRDVMKTGASRYGAEVLRVPALHKDGTGLSIAFTVALLGTREDSDYVIAAIIRDETARWREESSLRKRLAELEAKRP